MAFLDRSVRGAFVVFVAIEIIFKVGKQQQRRRQKFWFTDWREPDTNLLEVWRLLIEIWRPISSGLPTYAKANTFSQHATLYNKICW